MIEAFYERNPYELNKEEKAKLLTEELKELTAYHREKSKEYANFLEMLSYDEDKVKKVEDMCLR